jgi:hypothetical protein
MDHPCHKCGFNIEDGKAFCSQCSAPQIRVMIPEPLVAAATAIPATVAENPLELDYPLKAANPWPGAARNALQPCALAAGAGVLLMFSGLNPFVIALGAGFLAVILARRRSLGSTIRAAAGAKLGALTGLLFFAGSMLLELLAVVALRKGAEIRAEMMDKIQQAAGRYPGPEVQPFLDFVRSPGGFTFMLIAALIFGLLAFVALASVGGALGASMLGKKSRS